MDESFHERLSDQTSGAAASDSITPDEAKQLAEAINELLTGGQGQKALEAAVQLRGRLKKAVLDQPVLRKNLDSVESAIMKLQRAGFTPPASDGLKLCPYCAEEIQAAAVKCKHCGSNQMATPSGIVNVDAVKSRLAAGTVALRRAPAWLAAVCLVVVLISLLPLVSFVQRTGQSNMLQQAMDSVVGADPRNKGVIVRPYVSNVSPRVMTYDLTEVSDSNSPADVFRVLLQFAQAAKNESFDEVVLAFRGVPKFKLQGSYFAILGREYGSQNPIYTMRTFPENVKMMTGEAAYSTWTGGMLGVTNKQLEDFNDFHKRWYIYDLASKTSN